MKTSTKHLLVKHKDADNSRFSISIATESGELKSHLLKVLARSNKLLELPQSLFDEICQASDQRNGHYKKLIDYLMATTAYREASWNPDRHAAHYGLH